MSTTTFSLRGPIAAAATVVAAITVIELPAGHSLGDKIFECLKASGCVIIALAIIIAFGAAIWWFFGHKELPERTKTPIRRLWHYLPRFLLIVVGVLIGLIVVPALRHSKISMAWYTDLWNWQAGIAALIMVIALAVIGLTAFWPAGQRRVI